MKQIRLLFICILCLSAVIGTAQVIEKDEYKAEIGVIGGGSFYIGDANSLLFNNLQVTYGGFFRYNFNPRFALKAELISTNVPKLPNSNNKSINVGDITAEFNFFDLEINPYKRFSKTFSPYIFTGVSLFTGMYFGQALPEIGIPFGVGIKLKLKKRLNLNIQWSNKLLLADNLEVYSNISVSEKYNNPYNLNGSNVFNNDLLSTVTIGFSYDIWKKKCDCLNNNAFK
ncbi:MAG: outer membrane beta-barrel protein [Paludibacter sp.]|nr:outer membrane beta-barrel protein [Paludibacter sp.]